MPSALYNHPLPSATQRDQLSVVLVSPRNPLNIGAAARAMANFGFARLAVVAPYEPHWREARSAVGAERLLQNAQVLPALAEAVAECTLVIGTGTVGRRKPEQPVVPLPMLAPLVRREIERGRRVAMVFGPEKRGLTREDLAYCHLLAEIPTDPRQPSMNLGQAVAVCLYELASQLAGPELGAGRAVGRVSASEQDGRHDRSHSRDARLAASSGSLERVAEVVEKAMLAAGYSPAAMREANRHDLRLLLRRLTLTESDARRILGLFRRILWRLERGDGQRKGSAGPHGG